MSLSDINDIDANCLRLANGGDAAAAMRRIDAACLQVARELELAGLLEEIREDIDIRYGAPAAGVAAAIERETEAEIRAEHGDKVAAQWAAARVSGGVAALCRKAGGNA